MDRRLQTRMRENAASNGRHGSRFAVSMKSSSNSVGQENGKTLCGTAFADESIAGASLCPHATQGATAEEESGVDADLKAIRRALAVVERPLTCEEAAALIRAHPKTVKRMARRGDLPGHFRFGRWFFYASELDVWMRNRVTFTESLAPLEPEKYSCSGERDISSVIYVVNLASEGPTFGFGNAVVPARIVGARGKQ